MHHPTREPRVMQMGGNDSLRQTRGAVCAMAASYRTLQSRPAGVLLFRAVGFFSFLLQHTTNTIQLAINKSQGFIRWEQKQFRLLLLTDSFGVDEERLAITFRNGRVLDCQKEYLGIQFGL